MPLILSIFVFLFYSSTLFYGYVWDDRDQLSGIANLFHRGELWKLFAEPYWKVVGVSSHSAYFRPIAQLTFLFDLLFSNAAASHFINILLLIFAIHLVWRWVVRHELNQKFATIALLFWITHASVMEAVSWVSARNKFLAVVFYFLAIELIERGGRFRFSKLLLPIFIFFSIGSEESALFLVWTLSIWAYFCFRDRFRFVLLCTAGVSLLRLWLQIQFHAPTPAWSSPSAFAAAMSLGLGKIVFPFWVTETCLNRIWFFKAVIGAFGFVGLSFFVLVSKGRRPHFWLGVLWLTLPLVPLSLFPSQVNDLVPRYLVFSTLGFSILVVEVLTHAKRPMTRHFGMGIISLLTVLSAISTFRDRSMWKSDRALFETMVWHDPISFHGNLGLGVFVANEGRFQEAQLNFRKAQTCEPAHPRPHLLLAELFAKEGKDEEASAEFNRVSREAVTPSVYLESCAKIKLFTNEKKGAISCAQELTSLLPLSSNAWLLRAQILKKFEGPMATIPVLESALQVAPSEEAYNDLAILYGVTGDAVRAMSTMNEGLAKYPKGQLLRENMRRLQPSKRP